MKYFLLLSLCVCLNLFAHADEWISKKIQYSLIDEPIDVVIVSHPKDKEVIPRCIKGVRKYCKNVRRVIVVSTEKLTDEAEWFDEKLFPFSYKEVELAVGGGTQKKADKFFGQHNRGPGWYLQQLLKLYSAFVIPDISSNVLIVDADVVFLKPVKFMNKSLGGLFCVSQIEPKKLYIQHAERLVPSYKRILPQYYSVCHHMLFQRPILEDLFQQVEDYHQKPFWKAFCNCVKFHRKKNGSEYEIYFNFALRHTDQVEIRELKWINSGDFSLKKKFKREGYDFVAFQSYLIDKGVTIGKVGHD